MVVTSFVYWYDGNTFHSHFQGHSLINILHAKLCLRVCFLENTTYNITWTPELYLHVIAYQLCLGLGPKLGLSYIPCLVMVRAKLLQLCPTLCNPMDCSPSTSSGFSRQEYWSGLPCPFPGDLPNAGIEPLSPASQANSLPLSPGNLKGTSKHFQHFCPLMLGLTLQILEV